MARNLVNLSGVVKGFAARTVLDGITLGVEAGQRIGIVGANGQGKSTLLALIDGSEVPDAGAITRERGLSCARLSQSDELDGFQTVGEALVGARAQHEWAGDRPFRDVLDGLLGGVGLARLADGFATRVETLSGGERRRIALARLLLDAPELLLLDEPTNHLDVDAIDWLAGHLAARAGTLIVVTHDRWFLDAVCGDTWEIADGAVHRYEGGYAAYVLARAERDRREAVRGDRRRQLLRKELAWLRRGPPARTSKPKFRIEAANALIADEPVTRDSVELLRFAAARLGNKVLEAEDVSFRHPGRDADVLRRVTWRLGPGDRVALVGANGSGKSTLLALLAGELEPSHGRVDRGATVRLAHLRQDSAASVDDGQTVIESLEEIKREATLAGGAQVSAARLVERFGFRGDRARVRIGDLSGGERRRLALMRLLMAEPNVLLLDEPTNDLDIDTLTALEDLLDGWPGTLVVVSHDRYFVERVCDNVFALTGAGAVAHLPAGIDQYLEIARAAAAAAPAPVAGRGRPADASADGSADGSARGAAAAKERRRSGAELRAARKEADRLEREVERHVAREHELQELMAASASDHVRLATLGAELQAAIAAREELEGRWLELADALEG